MKIVFFGDNLTQGAYGANYVNKVASAMHGHHFINQGANGDTSLNLFRRVEDDVIAQKPDGVFIMISNTATRPGLSMRGINNCEITATITVESWMRIISCWFVGNAFVKRSIVFAAPVV